MLFLLFLVVRGVLARLATVPWMRTGMTCQSCLGRNNLLVTDGTSHFGHFFLLEVPGKWVIQSKNRDNSYIN